MSKIVVNNSCFSFKLPEKYAKTRGIHIRTDDITTRTDPDLIATVEADTYDGDLITVNLPNNYTQIGIFKHNGIEDIEVVVDGKKIYPLEEIIDVPLEQLFIN